MKTPILLLALLLAAPAALHAQTNREYNRLQEATQRAYSVPDRPAPRSAPAERSYTPSSSSGPNTPYSGGMQVVVPGTSLFGDERRQRRAQEEERMKNLAERERLEKEKEKEKEDKRLAAGQQAYHLEEERMGVLAREWVGIKFAYDDARRLGIMASGSASPEVAQAIAQVKQARMAVYTHWKEKDRPFAQVLALVNAEWVPAQEGRPSLGMYTALEDYMLIEKHFPAEASALEADLARLHVSFLTFDMLRMRKSLEEVTRYLPQHRAVIERAVLLQAPELTRNFRLLAGGKMSEEVRYDFSMHKYRGDIEDANEDRPIILSAVQLVQQVLEAENARNGTTSERQNCLRLCAELSLEIQSEISVLQQQELQKKRAQEVILLKQQVVTPEYLLALTDAQAQQVNTTLGITLGDQSARARLARMLPPLNALPDNPDWQALKAGEPLAETIRQLASKYDSSIGDLLLGTLAACTKLGKDGQDEAMKYWDKAKGRWDNGTSTLPVMRAAARNMYRAVMLEQGGDYKTTYHLKGKNEANQLLVLDMRWNDELYRYQSALIKLDQSPDFPPIGATMKKDAKAKLQYLAKDGYEPAKAKLKEL